MVWKSELTVDEDTMSLDSLTNYPALTVKYEMHTAFLEG